VPAIPEGQLTFRDDRIHEKHEGHLDLLELPRQSDISGRFILHGREQTDDLGPGLFIGRRLRRKRGVGVGAGNLVLAAGYSVEPADK
jgi:hypothetical protein